MASYLEQRDTVKVVSLCNTGLDDNDMQRLAEAIATSPSQPMVRRSGASLCTGDDDSVCFVGCLTSQQHASVPQPLECQLLSHWRKRDSNPGSSALEVDVLTTRPPRRRGGDDNDSNNNNEDDNGIRNSGYDHVARDKRSMCCT